MRYFGKKHSITADRGFENIGALVIYQLFLNVTEQLTKAEMKKSYQLGYIKWPIQHTSYKTFSSGQELNFIDSL